MESARSTFLGHRWRFYRCGGLDQVSLETGADLLALGGLDSKLWAALSCPTVGVEFDEKTLHLIDNDHDGRIRVAEVLAAVDWVCARLKNPDDLMKRSAVLPLVAINENHPDGKRLLASVRQILANLGKPSATEISIDDVNNTVTMFANTRLNGDGIVPASAAPNESLKRLIEEIMACIGSVPDRSGLPGISAGGVDRFYSEARSFSDWWKAAEADEKNVFPLGKKTAEAAYLLRDLGPKIDDFFTRCRLSAFDERVASRLGVADQAIDALLAQPLTTETEALKALPLAHPAPSAELSLTDRLNPAWAAAMSRFRTEVVEPLIGKRTVLNLSDWGDLRKGFAAYDAWLAKKPVTSVEFLGLNRIREILADDTEKDVRALIADDKALETEFNSISEVDRLVRYHRDILALLNNFATFLDFFSGKNKAMFQAGTLYIDGRACELCLRVADAAKHASLSALCNTYLAYCDCVRRGSTEKMTIVAAFTAGDSEQLNVGRNGVFFDRQGGEWDATIVKIVEHPISIGEAFWSPYRRLGRMISEQIEKLAASGDKAVQAGMTTGVADAGKTLAAAPVAPPAPFDVGKFAGIFAAIGLAVGALGTALASILAGFWGLHWWQMPLALGGVLLVISGPSMVMTWLKLGKRNLGPLLDANGWAVNTRATMNLRFAASLTKVAELPDGAKRYLEDPFADQKRPWMTYLLILCLLLGGGFALKKRGAIKRWFDHKGKPPAQMATASGTAILATGTVSPAVSGVTSGSVLLPGQPETPASGSATPR